ncbi:MAG: asparaginase [Mycobacteriales bacterium]|nr:asparaginase [Frankia sp.]
MTVVAEVVRSGFVESRHHGSVVALRPDGTVAFAVGEPEAVVFPRSSNKPLQAVGMLETGYAETFGLSDEHIALSAASHSGEPEHVKLVTDLLALADVLPEELHCPPALPLDETAANDVRMRDGGPTRLYHNCSGKHAAMLAACAAAGWDRGHYLEPTHPLQQQLRAVVERLAGEPVAVIGVDGCGAPVFGYSLLGLARAFAALGTAAPGAAAGRVANAMRAHPHLVGGTGRDVTRLMTAVPGLVAKDGAEGCFAAATAEGYAVALKIDDGATRARPPVMVAALRAGGVTGDPETLAALAEPPVLGGGEPVGAIRAVLSA